MCEFAMSKERLYLFDTTLRARLRAGASAPSTNKSEREPSRRRLVRAYGQGTTLSVRYDAARRRADDGRRFLGGRETAHRRRARRSRHRLRRGRLSRRQRHRHAVSGRGPHAQDGEAHRLRHDQALGPLGLQRSGPAGGAGRARQGDLPRLQGVGLPRARGARHHQRGEPEGAGAVGQSRHRDRAARR